MTAPKEKTDLYATEKGYAQKAYLLKCVYYGNRSNIESELRTPEFLKSMDELFQDNVDFAKSVFLFVWPQITCTAIDAGTPVRIADEIYNRFALRAKNSRSVQELIELNLQIYLEYASAVIKQQSEMKFSSLIQKCRNYIISHIDEPLTVSMISEALHFSHSYLSHQYKKETGETIHARIQTAKLAEAKLLLQNPSLTLNDIWKQLSYCSQSHFTASFRKATGMTPSEYRTKSSSSSFLYSNTSESSSIPQTPEVQLIEIFPTRNDEIILQRIKDYSEEVGYKQMEYFLSCVRNGDYSRLEAEFTSSKYISQLHELFEGSLSLAYQAVMFLWPQVSNAAVAGGMNIKVASKIFDKYYFKVHNATLEELLELNTQLFLEYAERVSLTRLGYIDRSDCQP